MLDDGRITDSQGRTVDFKNTILIMTSNIGAQLILEDLDKHGAHAGSDPASKTFAEAMMDGGKSLSSIGTGQTGGVNDFSAEISPQTQEAVMNMLHSHFRPEFLNRLDEIILFTPLTKDSIAGIIDLIVDDLNKRLEDRQIRIRLTDEAKVFIADAAYDPSYGARPLKRYIQKHVETLSARLILQDEVDEGDTIVIDVDGGALKASVEKA